VWYRSIEISIQTVSTVLDIIYFHTNKSAQYCVHIAHETLQYYNLEMRNYKKDDTMLEIRD